MKPKDENAKGRQWKTPVDLPGVLPEDYEAAIESSRDSAAPSGQDRKDGTTGFSPQLGGHGKAGKSHTSSFDLAPSDRPASSSAKAASPTGRDPMTSVIGRVSRKSGEMD